LAKSVAHPTTGICTNRRREDEKDEIKTKRAPTFQGRLEKRLKDPAPNPTDIFQKDYGELLKIFEENYLMVEANARVYKS
jgi:hypothetical protein